MEQGLVLLVIGMATVFAFLILLVGAMLLTAKFFMKFAHLFPEAQPKAAAPKTDAGIEVAVALAAIRAKRA
ncbi:MAG: OadG family protein [Kiritimatiellales bacterium]